MSKPSPSHDSVEDVVFKQTADSVSATHPRLGGVGHVWVEEVLPDDPARYELWPSPPPNLLEPGAYADFDALRTRLRKPDLRPFVVVNSWTHKLFRGEGLGQHMYLLTLASLARQGGALMPHDAIGGPGTTSDAALRVWRSLAGRPGLVVVGDAVWGGSVQVPPLRSRRSHGFLKADRPRGRDVDPET